jgi:hypothetical protein
MTSDGPQRQVHRRSADKTKFLEVCATASGSALANHKLAVPRVPVPKNESLYNESSCGGWIEFRDPALDGLLEVWVVHDRNPRRSMGRIQPVSDRSHSRGLNPGRAASDTARDPAPPRRSRNRRRRRIHRPSQRPAPQGIKPTALKYAISNGQRFRSPAIQPRMNEQRVHPKAQSDPEKNHRP